MLSFKLDEELAKYFNASSICRGGELNFALFTGGVGAGKTTVRHQKCGKDYVHLDAAEIFANFAKGKTYEFPTAFEEPLELIGDLIAKQAIEQKRNIAMEVIGNSLEDSRALIDAMKSVGYKVHLANIQCDPVESYKRHINAVQTDVNYVSAFHTQRFHYKWILNAVKEINMAQDLYGSESTVPEIQKVTWEDIAEIASKAFHLQGDHAVEMDWAKQAWQALEKAGATAYDHEIGRLKVIIRFFALVAIYYDFYSIMNAESEYKLWHGDWIYDLNVNPLYIGILASKDEKWSDNDVSDDESVALNDALRFLTDRARKEVYALLLKTLGDIGSLFVFLYRSVDTEEDEHFILNSQHFDANKQRAFDWALDGCGRVF
jgi:hypothetical protein